MRFTKPFWSGIADGSVTVAFRRWKKPTVVVGRIYRTGGGRVEVVSVERWARSKISAQDARLAGHDSVAELLASLHPGVDRNTFRVKFRLVEGSDPRDDLAAATSLSETDTAYIANSLERLDQASSFGPWTQTTLKLIESFPATRAPDLAEKMGRETKPFKLDVRKLKNLGLTLSLKVGYKLSPRGKAYQTSKKLCG